MRRTSPFALAAPAKVAPSLSSSLLIERRQGLSQDARIELGYVKQRIEKLVEYSQRCFTRSTTCFPFRRLKPGAQLRNEKAQGVQGLTQIVIRCGQKAGLRQLASSSCCVRSTTFRSWFA
jgi:hypothetical protein